MYKKKTSRNDVKCQSLFSRSSCYFLYLGTGKERITLVDLTLSHALFLKKNWKELQGTGTERQRAEMS